MYMQNRALEFISSTRHFTASSTLRANQHTKLNRAMLFTQQIFTSECDVTSEQYRISNNLASANTTNIAIVIREEILKLSV